MQKTLVRLILAAMLAAFASTTVMAAGPTPWPGTTPPGLPSR